MRAFTLLVLLLAVLGICGLFLEDGPPGALHGSRPAPLAAAARPRTLDASPSVNDSEEPASPSSPERTESDLRPSGACATAVGSATTGTSPGARTLTGRVVDIEGAPIGDAAVRIFAVRRVERHLTPLERGCMPVELRTFDAPEALTELGASRSLPDGRFEISPVASSGDAPEVFVVARARRYEGEWTGQTRLGASDEGWVLPDDELVVRRLFRVVVRVRDVGGAILDGALVTAEHSLPGNSYTRSVISISGVARGGVFELLAAAENVSLTAELAGYASSHRGLSLEADRTVDLVIGSGACIRGRVVSPDGAPVRAARVEALGRYVPEEMDEGHRNTVFDAARAIAGEDGTFMLSGLASGRAYTVFANAPGDRSTLDAELYRVVAPADLGLVSLGRAGSVAIHARAGGPLAEDAQATVFLEVLDEESREFQGRGCETASVGSAGGLEHLYSRVEPAVYRVFVAVSGEFEAMGCSEPVIVKGGECAEVAVRLAPSRTVQGRIVSIGGISQSGLGGALFVEGMRPRFSYGGSIGEDFSVSHVPLGESTLRIDLGDGGEHRVRIPPGVTDVGDISFP